MNAKQDHILADVNWTESLVLSIVHNVEVLLEDDKFTLEGITNNAIAKEAVRYKDVDEDELHLRLYEELLIRDLAYVAEIPQKGELKDIIWSRQESNDAHVLYSSAKVKHAVKQRIQNQNGKGFIPVQVDDENVCNIPAGTYKSDLIDHNKNKSIRLTEQGLFLINGNLLYPYPMLVIITSIPEGNCYHVLVENGEVKLVMNGKGVIYIRDIGTFNGPVPAPFNPLA